MPLQLGTSRNIVYVGAPEDGAPPAPPPEDPQQLLDAMVESEPICVRVASLFKTELQQALLFVDGKAVSEEFEFYYKQFLLDSVHYYLAHGFVPFRLRKVGAVFAPFVMSKNTVSWEEDEMGVDDYAPNVTVQRQSALLDKNKEKAPRIYVYTFDTQGLRGLLQPAAQDFAHLRHSRGYQVDYMNLSRESVFMWQRASAKPEHSDFGKANVNQILSVSDQFRLSLDHAAQAEADVVSENETKEHEKRELDRGLRQRPAVSTYSTSLALPLDMTGHVHTFRPPAVNHDAVQQAFNNAVMDACNIARTWAQGNHLRRDAARHAGDGLAAQEPKRAGHSGEDTQEAVKTLLLAYERMLSYIVTFILDPANKAKLKRQEPAGEEMDAAFAREKHKTVNVVNLYPRPTVAVEIGRVTTRDCDSLRDMFDSFMATDEDFSSGVFAATGMHVSKRYIELNRLKFDAQKKALQDAIRGEDGGGNAAAARGGNGGQAPARAGAEKREGESTGKRARERDGKEKEEGKDKDKDKDNGEGGGGTRARAS
jgi:hypothetical protein